jgi:hypothetical protein
VRDMGALMALVKSVSCMSRALFLNFRMSILESRGTRSGAPRAAPRSPPIICRTALLMVVNIEDAAFGK